MSSLQIIGPRTDGTSLAVRCDCGATASHYGFLTWRCSKCEARYEVKIQKLPRPRKGQDIQGQQVMKGCL